MKADVCFLFAGPTLYGNQRAALPVPANVHLLPPAQRGDIAAVIQDKAPGVLALADGLFHSHLAVGHAELREALERGWQVWGLSSMGAIRACEMRQLGMRGFGRVYQRFCGSEDFQDDEAALLHTPDAPYAALSEPLVHLRAALESFEQQGLLSHTACENIAARLKSLWYGDRTLPLFAEMLREACVPARWPEVKSTLTDFDRCRWKTRDLEAFLHTQPWRETAAAFCLVHSDS